MSWWWCLSSIIRRMSTIFFLVVWWQNDGHGDFGRPCCDTGSTWRRFPPGWVCWGGWGRTRVGESRRWSTVTQIGTIIHCTIFEFLRRVVRRRYDRSDW
jgi:hypothetical protein